MSPQNETILSKQIKGLTWGVVLTLVTTFAGGVYIAFTGYMRIIEAIQNSARDNTILRNDVNAIRGDVSRHEAQIQYLMTKQNSK